MSDTTTEPMVTTIEAHHKRALLNADSVTFHFRDGQGSIRAHRRGEHAASGFDEYVEIYTMTSVDNYQRDDVPSQSYDPKIYDCFHMEHGATRYDLDLLSLVNRIRVGDKLKLAWTRGNDNNLNREINWHRDELRLHIGHPNNKGERYLVTTQTGPDNTARMVRVL